MEQLLARFPLFWWDHALTLLGTRLRFGELAGLRRRRVRLDRTPPVVQVVDIRYQAGRFGSGFKPRPKSDAGIRELPLAPEVVAAVRRQLPPGTDPEDLVFTGPSGDPPLDAVDLRGAHDFRHTFATWLEDAGIPARVIDELMGHEASTRGAQHLGSTMGAHYRHTTPEMATRVVMAIQDRLAVVVSVAEQVVEAQPTRVPRNVF
jgi:integrase